MTGSLCPAQAFSYEEKGDRLRWMRWKPNLHLISLAAARSRRFCRGGSPRPPAKNTVWCFIYPRAIACSDSRVTVPAASAAELMNCSGSPRDLSRGAYKKSPKPVGDPKLRRGSSPPHPQCRLPRTGSVYDIATRISGALRSALLSLPQSRITQ